MGFLMVEQLNINDFKPLAELNPNKKSVTFSNGKLAITNKRSAIRNFFSWVIYIITFTLVPRNANLDKVTRTIFEEAERISKGKKLNAEEKNTIYKAIQNIKTIIEKNGGSESKKVAQLLATIEKIETLDTVKQLAKPTRERNSSNNSLDYQNKPADKEMTQEQNPQQKTTFSSSNENSVSKQHSSSTDTRLQKFLIECASVKDYSIQKVEDLCKLLEQIESSVPLNEDQKTVLNDITNNIEWLMEYRKKPSWIQTKAKELSPNLIRFLVENSTKDNNKIISQLYSALIVPPIKKIYLKTFILALIEQQNNIQPISLYSFTPELIPIIKDILSKDELNKFLSYVFRHTSIQTKALTLELINSFGEEHRKVILETLCDSDNPKFLSKVLSLSRPEENILEKIFQLNPAKGEHDGWFSDFLTHVDHAKVVNYVIQNEPEARKIELIHNIDLSSLKAILKQFPKDPLKESDDVFLLIIKTANLKYMEFADYIIQNETKERKNLLFIHGSFDVKLKYIDQIPSEVVDQFSKDTLLFLTSKVNQTQNLDKIAKALEKKMEGTDSAFHNVGIFAFSLRKLFLHFSPDYQCTILLQDKYNHYLHDENFKNLDPKIKDQFYQTWAPIIEKKISAESLLTKDFLSYKILTKVFGYFSSDFQITLLAKLIEFSMNGGLWKEVIKLPPKSWEKASSKVTEYVFEHTLKDCSIEQYVAFVNVRNRKNFDLDNFFEKFFGKATSENQLLIIKCLKPDFFDKIIFQQKNSSAWSCLFNSLIKDIENDHTKDMFVAALEALFNSGGYVCPDSTLTSELMRIILSFLTKEKPIFPLEKCSPSMRLLLVHLTERFKDPEINELLHDTVAKFTEEDKKLFSSYFRNIYNGSYAFSSFGNLIHQLSKIDTNYSLIDYFLVNIFDELPSLINFSKEREVSFSFISQDILKRIIDKKLHGKNDIPFILANLNGELARSFIKDNYENLERQLYNNPESFKENSSGIKIIEHTYNWGILSSMVVKKLLNLNSYSSLFEVSLLRHLNQCPWKLFLGFDYGKVSFKDWITQNHKDHVKNLPEIPNINLENIDQKLNKFFIAVEKMNWLDTVKSYNDIPEEIRKLLVVWLTNDSKVQHGLMTLIDVHPGLWCAALLDQQVFETFIQLIKDHPNHPTVLDIIKFFDEMNKNMKDQKDSAVLLNKFLNTSLKLPRTNIMNDSFTDMKLQIDGKTMGVHRSLMTLIPEFKGFIKNDMNETIVLENILDEAKREEVKKKINHIYQNYKIEDLLLPEVRKNIKNPINCTVLFDNPDSFPDFKLSNGETTILVHRTILNQIPFFRSAFNTNTREIQSGIMLFLRKKGDKPLDKESDPFDAIRFLVECVYGKHQNFRDEDIDEESKQAINSAYAFLFGENEIK